MKHENFKAFSDLDAANEFLKDTLILPKSISVSVIYNHSYFFIGYIETKQEHHYKIEKIQMEARKFIKSKNDIDFVMMMNAIEEEAKNHGGVICQDISMTDYFIKVYFLTAK